MTGEHGRVVDAEVVVIGGGPAGAVAARLLALWGRDVVVIARAGPARALAESLPPSCGRLLDRAGVTDAVAAAGFVRATGNTVWWGGAEARTEVFAEGGLGYQVDRTAFDRLLLDQAAAAGCRVLDGTVRAVEAGSHFRRRVAFRAERVVRSVEARWVIDASGRSGVVARHGWRRPVASPRTTALIGVWERPRGWAVPDATHTLVESYGNGWAWSVPLSAVRRCIAVMVDPALTPLHGRSRLEAAYHAELAATARFRALVEDAAAVVRPWACDASAYAAHRVTGEGVLLVGDAASFVDPLSSYGVKKALASAWLGAVVVNTCLSRPAAREAALELHESRERRMFETLHRQYAAFSARAAAGHDAGFWQERAGPAIGEAATERDATAADEPDVAALRTDPDVLAAFEALKRSSSIRLRPTAALRRVERPLVQGNLVTLVEHLAAPAFPRGIRYVRDVDLVRLAQLAGDHDQVPDLYEAYVRAAPPVALADFLGAVSLLVGKGLLENA